MGAEFQVYRITAKNAKEVKEKYRNLVDSALHAHGHSGYTGSIAESPGLSFHATQARSLEESDKIIEENTKKWEDSLAVQYDTDKWLVGGWYSS